VQVHRCFDGWEAETFPVSGDCVPRMLHAHRSPAPMRLGGRREGTEEPNGKDGED
jgi:hypothetical protein